MCGGHNNCNPKLAHITLDRGSALPDCLIVNACNKEGTLVIFAWNGKELIRKDEIILPGASCTVYLSGK